MELLLKGRKDAVQMYKPEHPGSATAKEHINWAYQKMPNENWSLWTVRHHRNKPEDFTPEVKTKLEHFAGSQHIPEVANVRFDKTQDLHSGLQTLEAAEKQYIDRKKANLNLATKPKSAKKVLDFGDGTAWWSLGKGVCSSEGKAMGHCGNAGNPQEGDDIYSLRTSHKLGGKTYYEPHLTFIARPKEGVFSEMKGRGNQKPAPEYHDKVAALLHHTGFFPEGGGYLPENNFHLSDLPAEHSQKLVEKNPAWEVALPGKPSKRGVLAAMKSPNFAAKLKPEDLDLSDPDVADAALDAQPMFIASRAGANPALTAEQRRRAMDTNAVNGLAENPSLTPDEATQLYERGMRGALLHHASTPMGAVRRALGLDPSVDRTHDTDQQYAIYHPGLTTQDLSSIMRQPARGMRSWTMLKAAKHPNADQSEVYKLAHERPEVFGTAVADKPSIAGDVELQNKLAQSTYSAPMLAVNPAVDPGVLRGIIDSGTVYGNSGEYAYKALQNPALRGQNLAEVSDRALVHRDAKSVAHLLGNPNIAPEFRQRVAKGLADFAVGNSIFSRENLYEALAPTATKDEIRTMARDKYAFSPNRLILADMNSPSAGRMPLELLGEFGSYGPSRHPGAQGLFEKRLATANVDELKDAIMNVDPKSSATVTSKLFDALRSRATPKQVEDVEFEFELKHDWKP